LLFLLISCFNFFLLKKILWNFLTTQIIKRSTSRKATTGSNIARVDNENEAPASVVDKTGFAIPQVVVEEVNLNKPVECCIVPANPPPAIIASDHFNKGEKSARTEPITSAPAIIEAGPAMVSKRLSNQGKKYATISTSDANPKAIRAG